ncbi:hypothetical protein SAMN05192553_101349 [Cyclobacterium xiamenense]|uniref:Uncharacterized protein n=1 Tax=Cyclobacterium xiamenense TaxID=1297121 RepID=A0A1H6TVB7_9BACT|nr:hypothetical protein SAMN05192553_101349 [Cyclobacterium xiamenense]
MGPLCCKVAEYPHPLYLLAHNVENRLAKTRFLPASLTNDHYRGSKASNLRNSWKLVRLWLPFAY